MSPCNSGHFYCEVFPEVAHHPLVESSVQASYSTPLYIIGTQLSPLLFPIRRLKDGGIFIRVLTISTVGVGDVGGTSICAGGTPTGKQANVGWKVRKEVFDIQSFCLHKQMEVYKY